MHCYILNSLNYFLLLKRGYQKAKESQIIYLTPITVSTFIDAIDKLWVSKILLKMAAVSAPLCQELLKVLRFNCLTNVLNYVLMHVLKLFALNYISVKLSIESS